MQRNGDVLWVWVVDSVKSYFVGDVGDLVGGVCAGFLNLETFIYYTMVIGRVFVDRLSKFTGEHLHDAVSSGMVMNRGSFVRVPN